MSTDPDVEHAEDIPDETSDQQHDDRWRRRIIRPGLVWLTAVAVAGVIQTAVHLVIGAYQIAALTGTGTALAATAGLVTRQTHPARQRHTTRRAS